MGLVGGWVFCSCRVHGTQKIWDLFLSVNYLGISFWLCVLYFLRMVICSSPSRDHVAIIFVH